MANKCPNSLVAWINLGLIIVSKAKPGEIIVCPFYCFIPWKGLFTSHCAIKGLWTPTSLSTVKILILFVPIPTCFYPKIPLQQTFSIYYIAWINSVWRAGAKFILPLYIYIQYNNEAFKISGTPFALALHSKLIRAK